MDLESKFSTALDQISAGLASITKHSNYTD